MRRLFSIVLLAGACVPAAEEPVPRGAAGIATTPSFAARGEPFVTDDGWAVRFDTVLLAAFLTVYDAAEYGSSELRLWDGRRRTEMFARAQAVGPCRVGLSLASFYYGRALDRGGGEGRPRSPDLPDSTVERFSSPADDDDDDRASSASGGVFRRGPAIVVALRAEKAGRVVSLSLGLSSRSTPSLRGEVEGHVEVRANAVTFADATVEPERMLLSDPGAGRRTFEEVAAADRNGDGVASPDELRAVRVRVSRDGTWTVDDGCEVGSSEFAGDLCESLLGALGHRANAMLVLP